MKTPTALWILSGLTVILLGGCFKDDLDNMGGGNNQYRLKANIGLEMANVAGFTLVPEGEAASTSPYQKANSGDCLLSTNTGGTPGGACTKLYALSATGGILPVELVDAIENDNNDNNDGKNDGGNNCCMQQPPPVPETIYNVGNFVFFVYPMQLHTQFGSCGMVVLEKKDGALYCSLDSVITCQQTDGCHGFPADMLVQANGDGTLVHAMGGNMGLLQLDFADPVSALSRTLFDSTDGFLRYFRSNGNGDVLSIVGITGSNKLDLRLYKRSGGFVNLPAFSTGVMGESLCFYPGLGTDSNNHYVITPGGNNIGGGTVFAAELQNRITRVGLAAGEITTSTYAHDITGGLALGMCNGQNMSQASTLDRHFIGFMPGNMGIGENQFTEVYNPAGIPARRTITEFKSITKMYGCDNQVILRGRDAQENDMIARYYPDTVSTSVVINSVDYSITAVAVSDGCEISFGGRRASDNSRILGNIPVDTNEVTVYSNNLPGDVKALVRIK